MRNLKAKLYVMYEGIMICLVILSLVEVLSNDSGRFGQVHKIIWIIFLVDVTVRFVKATVKWKYVRNNPFDIVSVIPLDDIFFLARFARFLKLFRYKNLMKRYLDRISELVERIGIFKISLFVALLNILIALLVVIYTDLTMFEGTLWVWSNFLKFNYVSNVEGLLFLAVMMKVCGIIYLGIVIKKVLDFAKGWYEKYKLKRMNGNASIRKGLCDKVSKKFYSNDKKYLR